MSSGAFRAELRWIRCWFGGEKQTDSLLVVYWVRLTTVHHSSIPWVSAVLRVDPSCEGGLVCNLKIFLTSLCFLITTSNMMRPLCTVAECAHMFTWSNSNGPAWSSWIHKGPQSQNSDQEEGLDGSSVGKRVAKMAINGRKLKQGPKLGRLSRTIMSYNSLSIRNTMK